MPTLQAAVLWLLSQRQSSPSGVQPVAASRQPTRSLILAKVNSTTDFAGHAVHTSTSSLSERIKIVYSALKPVAEKEKEQPQQQQDFAALAAMASTLRPKFQFWEVAGDLQTVQLQEARHDLFNRLIRNCSDKEQIAQAHEQHVVIPANSCFMLADLANINRFLAGKFLPAAKPVTLFMSTVALLTPLHLHVCHLAVPGAANAAAPGIL